MLDSLVRVSRRVGGVTDLLATEMPAAPARALAIQAGSSTRRPRRQNAGACHRKRQQTSPDATFLRQRFVAQSPGEVQPPSRQTEARRPCGSEAPRPPTSQPESPRPASRAPPFTTTQFHVLLNSLFKVLFNFPSRYLFAIGLATVFSLGWSLPPVLGLRSQATRLSGQQKLHYRSITRGLTPALGKPHSRELGSTIIQQKLSFTPQFLT